MQQQAAAVARHSDVCVILVERKEGRKGRNESRLI